MRSRVDLRVCHGCQDCPVGYWNRSLTATPATPHPSTHMVGSPTLDITGRAYPVFGEATANALAPTLMLRGVPIVEFPQYAQGPRVKIPPSTIRVCPEMKSASSAQRNATASATSRGYPTRPTGVSLAHVPA